MEKDVTVSWPVPRTPAGAPAQGKKVMMLPGLPPPSP
jgi:hypothetical protein